MSQKPVEGMIEVRVSLGSGLEVMGITDVIWKEPALLEKPVSFTEWPRGDRAGNGEERKGGAASM